MAISSQVGQDFINGSGKSYWNAAKAAGNTGPAQQAYLAKLNEYASSRRTEGMGIARKGATDSSANGTLFNHNADIARGQKVGIQRAQDYYGMNRKDFGAKNQRNLNALENRAYGADPISGQQQNAMSRSLRRMKASGASQGQINQAAQQNALNYSSAAFSRQGTALNDYRRLLGNFMSGGQQLEYNMASLGNASQPIQAPKYQSGGICVICTELNRQGILDDETYVKDAEYGRYLWDNNIYILIGYTLWASKLVELMRKSKLVTKLVSYPALKWADNMADDHNFVGKMLKTFGEPICNAIGHLYVWSKKCTLRKV